MAFSAHPFCTPLIVTVTRSALAQSAIFYQVSMESMDHWASSEGRHYLAGREVPVARKDRDAEIQQVEI